MPRCMQHREEQGTMSISDKIKSFQGLSLSLGESSNNGQSPCNMAGNVGRGNTVSDESIEERHQSIEKR